MILGFGEMLEDERPPEDIWLSDEELDQHFTRLREKRKGKDDGFEEVPDLEQNELTKGLR